MSEPLVVWHAPFLSSGGYCSEAISFAAALSDSRALELRVRQFGDAFNRDFVDGLSLRTRSLLSKLMRVPADDASRRVRIDVCHAEPGAWSAPHPLYESGFHPCPSGEAHYTIGRTMFETDRLPDGWAARIAFLNEVWVPTDFSRGVFEVAGVPAAKIHVVGEGVDTAFFDRARVPTERRARFRICHVGKFERRKNLEGLIRAFARAFAHDGAAAAELSILTAAYHSSDDFRAQLAASLPGVSLDNVQLVSGVDDERLVAFYAGCDVYATASHGEGFGRPLVEAMSMSLPVISPFWSGPTSFLAPEFAFLVPVTELEPVGEGAFATHLWARVDEAALAAAMQAAAADVESTRRMGERARAYAVDKLCLKCIAAVVEQRIHDVASKITPHDEL